MIKDELQKRIDDGDAILRMTQTDGWQILESLLKEQLELYKVDVLFNAKTWEQYQEQRGKAFAINLLLTDIEDFVRMAEEAKDDITKLDT